MNDRASRRDMFASVALHALLVNQGRREHISTLGRIQRLIGITPRVSYEYNFDDCVKNAFDLADRMEKARKGNQQSESVERISSQTIESDPKIDLQDHNIDLDPILNPNYNDIAKNFCL